MTGAYRSGISYRLDLTISKVDGFTYADQITATVNGNSVNVVKSGNDYRILYVLPGPYGPDVQPEQPQEEQPEENKCPWCDQVHGDGFFEKIVAWFHSIFAKLFKH